MRFQKVGISLIVASCLLGAGTVGILNREAFAKEANTWHILPQSEYFSELYFTEPRQLPTEFASDQTVTFTVHNLENRTTTYGYTVLAVPAQASKAKYKVGEGEFTLGQNQSQTTRQRIALPFPPERTAIRIILRYDQLEAGHDTSSSRQQSIYYWVSPLDEVTQ